MLLIGLSLTLASVDVVLLLLLLGKSSSLLILNQNLLLSRLLLRRQLRVTYLPLATLYAISLSIQLSCIVFEEHIVLVNPHLNVIKLSCTLILKQLILPYARLLHGHNQLFAIPDHIIREVRPLEL